MQVQLARSPSESWLGEMISLEKQFQPGFSLDSLLLHCLGTGSQPAALSSAGKGSHEPEEHEGDQLVSVGSWGLRQSLGGIWQIEPPLLDSKAEMLPGNQSFFHQQTSELLLAATSFTFTCQMEGSSSVQVTLSTLLKPGRT